MHKRLEAGGGMRYLNVGNLAVDIIGNRFGGSVASARPSANNTSK